MSDLGSLRTLEELCFEPDRRDAIATIRRSLRHPRHEVWVRDAGENRVDVALFLRIVRSSLRIYSLAVHPDLRGQGWGNLALAFSEARARDLGLSRVTLEADAGLPGLLAWYERHGFRRDRFLPDFYCSGRDAWRLSRDLIDD